MSGERVDEIAPDVLEEELRDGAPVVVIDTRDRPSFAAWHLDPGAATLVNVPEAEIGADADAALAAVPADARVRLICNAGNASRRVAAGLDGRFAELLSVSGGMIGWSRVLTPSEVALRTGTRVVQLRREARGCLSYVIASDGEALVVDPAPDPEPYLEAAERLGARVVRVFDTHVHADHLSGARELVRRTGAVYHQSAPALARGVRYADEVTPVRDGDRIALGSAEIRVVALPGHTSDMTGLLVDGVALVGGDSVFADSIARPDLEAGDEGADAAARVLYGTLSTVVRALPPETVLLPCHYPGGRVDGPVAPTLGEVWAAIPALGLPEDAFVAELLGSMPPRPANYLEIIAVNLGEEMEPSAAARLEIGANNCAVSESWDRSRP